MKYTIHGGCAYLTGPLYDTGRVIDASEEIIDLFTAQFGRGESTVTSGQDGFRKRISWPDPGKKLARDCWNRMAEVYEVVDGSLVHEVGPLTVKTFLLGKTWCVYHAAADELTTPRLRPVGELDPVPVIGIYGAEGSPGSYAMLPPTVIRMVEMLLRDELPHLKIKMERIQAPGSIPGESFVREVAFLHFSHQRYGAGIGPMRVRCVTPDGGEVESTILLN